MAPSCARRRTLGGRAGSNAQSAVPALMQSVAAVPAVVSRAGSAFTRIYRRLADTGPSVWHARAPPRGRASIRPARQGQDETRCIFWFVCGTNAERRRLYILTAVGKGRTRRARRDASSAPRVGDRRGGSRAGAPRRAGRGPDDVAAAATRGGRRDSEGRKRGDLYEVEAVVEVPHQRQQRRLPPRLPPRTPRRQGRVLSEWGWVSHRLTMGASSRP